MTQLPLLDLAVIDDLSKHIGAEFTLSVLSLFIGESRGYLATIAQAGAQPSDPDRRQLASRAAHSLKSSAGQVGAAALSAAAAAVELAATDGVPDLAQAAASLQQCAEETLQAVNEFLAK